MPPGSPLSVLLPRTSFLMSTSSDGGNARDVKSSTHFHGDVTASPRPPSVSFLSSKLTHAHTPLCAHTPTHTCAPTHRHSQQHGLPLGHNPPEGTETCCISTAQKDHSPSDQKKKTRPRSRPQMEPEQSRTSPDPLKALPELSPDPVTKVASISQPFSRPCPYRSCAS